jgi:hypothetical protein
MGEPPFRFEMAWIYPSGVKDLLQRVTGILVHSTMVPFADLL